MRVDLHAKVRTRDGEDAGSVDFAVIDPETNEITSFVIGTGGLLGREIVVPRQELESATREGEALHLDLGKEELDRMPDFDPSLYATPPGGWVPPATGYPVTGYLWSSAYACAFNPYACAPLQRRHPGETEGGVEAGVEIEKGALVLDRQGEDVGVVDDLLFDLDSGRLEGLVIRVDGALQTLLGGGRTVEIDARLIDRVDQNVVHLRVDGQEIERRAG